MKKKINKEKSVICANWYDRVSLGTKGVFVDNFDYPDNYFESTLCGIRMGKETPFLNTYGNWYKYFVPERTMVLEEPKQIRAYTINEFLNKFPFLSVITLREKGNNDCVLTCAFSAYRCRLICIDVCFGVEWISLGTLFDKFEYKDTLGNWVPFGVEDEED